MKSLSFILAIAVAAFAVAAETGPSAGPFRRVFQQNTASPEQAAPKQVAPLFKVEAAQPAINPSYSTVEVAQQSSEVDTAEVLRRGDRVTRSGVGPMGTVEQLIGEATAPPPDDSHKWFITVIVDESKDSQAMLYDLKHSPHLRAWANIDEPKESWSHVNVYEKSDEKQNYRWKSLVITAYPVMLIQPPAKLRDESKKDSWIFGKPDSVVWQWDGYQGSNPHRATLRADAINKAISVYVAKLSGKQIQAVEPIPASRETPKPTPGAKAVDDDKGTAGPRQNDVGVTPPFAVPSVNPTVPVAPVFPSDPTIPTPGVPSSVPGLTDLLSLGLKFLGSYMTPAYLGVLLLALLVVIQAEKSIRDYRRKNGLPLIIPEELQSVIDSFQGLIGQMTKSGPPASQSQSTNQGPPTSQ